MVALHDRHLNGILADEMGLGKTVQARTCIFMQATISCLWAISSCHQNRRTSFGFSAVRKHMSWRQWVNSFVKVAQSNTSCIATINISQKATKDLSAGACLDCTPHWDKKGMSTFPDSSTCGSGSKLGEGGSSLATTAGGYVLSRTFSWPHASLWANGQLLLWLSCCHLPYLLSVASELPSCLPLYLWGRFWVILYANLLHDLAKQSMECSISLVLELAKYLQLFLSHCWQSAGSFNENKCCSSACPDKSWSSDERCLKIEPHQLVLFGDGWGSQAQEFKLQIDSYAERLLCWASPVVDR